MLRFTKGGTHGSPRFWYYITFELKSKERMELRVKLPDYVDIDEGDEGNLRYQGTRFIGFTNKWRY